MALDQKLALRLGFRLIEYQRQSLLELQPGVGQPAFAQGQSGELEINLRALGMLGGGLLQRGPTLRNLFARQEQLG